MAKRNIKLAKLSIIKKMERLKEKVEKLEKDYKYSAKMYGHYSRLMIIPSIIITSTSSIFSFLSSSEFVGEKFKNYCIIAVALLTTISTMLQTISSSCEFNVKKLKFLEATHSFNHLTDRIFFEIQEANEENFVDDIEKEIEKIKNDCKFIPLESKENIKKQRFITNEIFL
tara:strand:- start:86 stop:598 length:513 start_codon:yes stop_codon:yes gene_type:complete